MGNSGTSSFSYSLSTALQAGQASAAMINRTLLTRRLERNLASATAVEEYCERSAPHWGQMEAESGDWVLQRVQVRIRRLSGQRFCHSIAWPRSVNVPRSSRATPLIRR
jgi:hypothetical protein